MSGFMILKIFNDNTKENLYPDHDGELPIQFETREEAEAKAESMRKIWDALEVVTVEEALKYPIPKRW